MSFQFFFLLLTYSKTILLIIFIDSSVLLKCFRLTLSEKDPVNLNPGKHQ